MRQSIGSICLAGILTCAALPLAARAQVDMNGSWGVDEQLGLGFDIGTFVQTGSTLSATIWDFPWTGTIDPASGAFTLTGPSGPLCSPPVLLGMVDPAGTSFSATLTVSTPTGPSPPCTFASFPVTGRRCGNGVVDPGEQCDDGNFADGDCCSSACVLAADGASCDDALFCNGADTCAGGVCVHGGNPCAAAPPCVSCSEATDRCAPVPRLDCKGPVESGKSQLGITNDSPDKNDQLKWTLKKAFDTTLAELGQPDLGDDYTLCIFDGSSPAGALVLSARAPAGADWRPTSKGFKYTSTSLAPDGLQSVALTSGGFGKAKMSLKGRGELLWLPTAETPLPLPLIVELRSETGACWGADLSAPALNSGTSFKAKSD